MAGALVGSVGAAVSHPSTVAAIHPQDQLLARTLSLRLEDFDSGWTRASSPSDKLRRITCGSAPKIQRYITGFNDSAVFRPVDGSPPSAYSVTRVFPSEAAAKRWFNFAGGGKQAVCSAAQDVPYWKKAGYSVLRPRIGRQSFRASCYPCPPHQLAAWSIRTGLAKSGSYNTLFNDWVVVRVDRAVIGFDFYDVDSQFIGSQSLVGSVLERAP